MKDILPILRSINLLVKIIKKTPLKIAVGWGVAICMGIISVIFLTTITENSLMLCVGYSIFFFCIAGTMYTTMAAEKLWYGKRSERTNAMAMILICAGVAQLGCTWVFSYDLEILNNPIRLLQICFPALLCSALFGILGAVYISIATKIAHHVSR